MNKYSLEIIPMEYTENRCVKVIAENIYNGYHYMVISYGTHPCAYVELPKDHPYYNKEYDSMDIACHGGLTYSNMNYGCKENVYKEGFWIGWDYAHYGDYTCGTFVDPDEKKWTTEEIICEAKRVIKQLEEIKNLQISREDFE